jgi:hypothetical protein
VIASAMVTYGPITAVSSASWIRASWSAPMAARSASEAWSRCERMNTCPITTPAIEPIGLNDCARLSRRVAVSGGPITITYGFALVSSTESPPARTKSATRKCAYTMVWLAG